MSSNEWFKKIVSACNEAGTYKECFGEIISTLSQILEKRDDAETLYKDSKSKPVIVMSKGGASKPCKNPILAVWIELNSLALQYWRELGLTPQGFRNLGKDFKDVNKTTLSGILEKVK